MIIKYPDGSQKEYESGVKVSQITGDISEGLLRQSLGAVVNGEILGLDDKVYEDADFKVVKFEDKEGKQIFWHTASHIMAYAIQELYPDTKFAIGPSTETGFYYDLDLEHRFVEEDFKAIEDKMKEIAKKDLPVERIEISREEALKYFKEKGQDYKVELINDLPADEKITMYKIGDFLDLCKGPHLLSTKKIKAIKLLSIAGAYWRGDSNNKMLQRLYGIAFEKQSQLEEYITRREEAEKRDHRKLGKELDLFSMHEEGPGFPFFHPNGMILRNNLLNWWRGVLDENGYGEILTPIILNEALWHRSGHWDHYKDNMYFTKIDDGDYAVKPMNCPGSILVYNSNKHSYRDLPIRLAEYGIVHRHELSGALHGLFRVRTFTQDDAHVYCLFSQVKDEVFKMIDLADYLYSTFGFKYSIELSTRPDDYMGELEAWNLAEKSLKEALEEKNLPYTINEGDGAFYGPKIDFHLEDAIGRTWQCGTIQLDFQLPENFDLTYVDENGERQRPVMLHRALLGSVERFMGILIEHFAGKFPLWLSPVQVEVIPVSDKFKDFAESIADKLHAAGLRVHLDGRAEKVGYKIREAQVKKINYMLVIGEKEETSGKLSVRKRNGEEVQDVDVDEFIASLKEEIKNKTITD
ncbi:MAG: threonine--tRNA ligase [Peptoniphilus harei]|uniref:Threonine--tRNA ligase n=1 Tax=Peptoniphilus harei ACS-146-V-Sch2b TaxID=908338 RepID=E4KYR2_9FIRM|nr:threonine--tRNA ligase [Peptoniphilus harei]EFR32993.1 threonine--tRNA ligase [Peptoniphilus harei ACS-146-V-Sch2b]MDK7755959.1 threonine--tRNA ligase [Peptoniphilus harei]MDK7761724.1 threonine--tRNA ligase [Peptoniphilus harei]MDK8271383.1 threonine--tRNA ligase [Peptoniphilus harei]MDK8339958.1 threonine--tRNA ligase [Peptoniphilus harei]